MVKALFFVKSIIQAFQSGPKYSILTGNKPKAKYKTFRGDGFGDHNSVAGLGAMGAGRMEPSPPYYTNTAGQRGITRLLGEGLGAGLPLFGGAGEW
ncbi:hypothetical protein D3C75_775420 [compost metagenome]